MQNDSERQETRRLIKEAVSAQDAIATLRHAQTLLYLRQARGHNLLRLRLCQCLRLSHLPGSGKEAQNLHHSFGHRRAHPSLSDRRGCLIRIRARHPGRRLRLLLRRDVEPSKQPHPLCSRPRSRHPRPRRHRGGLADLCANGKGTSVDGQGASVDQAVAESLLSRMTPDAQQPSLRHLRPPARTRLRHPRHQFPRRRGRCKPAQQPASARSLA